MNKLSWFLYCADALSNITILFMVFGVICAAVGTLGWAAWTAARGDRVHQKDEGENIAAEWDEWISVWNPLRKFLWIGFALILVTCLFPSKTTMYAIAASQIGEQIAKADSVQGIANDATRALQSWIKKQIEPSQK